MPNGLDVSEHQSSFPAGDFDFCIVRLINENGGTDKRWQAHYDEAKNRGLAIGAYGIIRPGGISAVEWADRYVGLLAQRPWEIIPTVDIELGDPAANRPYAESVNVVLRERYPVLMGYYSAASAYRALCSPLYDRHWLAQWSNQNPGGDLWQYQGAPLDLDRCDSLEPIALRAIPTEEDLDMDDGHFQLLAADAVNKALDIPDVQNKLRLQVVAALLEALEQPQVKRLLKEAVR